MRRTLTCLKLKVAARQLSEYLTKSEISTLDAILVIVSATERFTQDLTAGIRLMEAALGEGSLAQVGTVVFTRGEPGPTTTCHLITSVFAYMVQLLPSLLHF